MGVDSRNKRASCLLFDMPFSRTFPNPDGSLANRADRQHMVGKYAFSLAAIVITFFNGLTTTWRLTGVGHG
jgi:hypothetical protein